MKNKAVIGSVAAVIALSCMMSACSGGSDKATHDSASVHETTVIIETTADGGTIEKDAEDNKITKDKKGKVIAVEDKDGNTLVVTEYLTTHSWVEYSGAKDKSSDNSSDSNKGTDKDKSGSGNSGNNGTSSRADSDSEGEVPVVIATLPDDDQLKDVPDL